MKMNSNDKTARKIVGGSGRYDETAKTWRVSRSGGRPTAWLLATIAKIKKAGFKEQPRPDSRWNGDNVTHFDLFIHRDGRRAAISRYIGTTKRDNSYSVIVDTVSSAEKAKVNAKTPVKLPKIISLGELRRTAETDSRYLQLAIIAAENLGGRVRPPKENAEPGDASYEMALSDAMRWLRTNADETGSERGVVAEVNFVRDLVK